LKVNGRNPFIASFAMPSAIIGTFSGGTNLSGDQTAICFCEKPLSRPGQEQSPGEYADGIRKHLYIAKKVGLLRDKSARILPIRAERLEKRQDASFSRFPH
jgi:hypothetical protein